MAYDPLTPARFRELKPNFCGVPDATLRDYILLGSRFVDESWSEKDYETAWASISCHLLTLDGFGESTDAEVAQAGGPRVSSLKSGSLSITFSPSSDASDLDGWLSQTACGRFYAVLLKLNRSGPRIITGGNFLPSGYAKDWPWPTG